MDKLVTVVGFSVLAVIAVVAMGLLLSLPVMWLWNGCLVAAIPGIKTIGWLQAWGIMILSGMLFKPASVSRKD